jgi:hypothetical protein
MPAPTFDDWLAQRSTTFMRQPLSGGWFGVLLGVTGNVNQEVWLLASRFHLLDDPASPDDVLPLIAQDRKLPRYPLETAAQHRQRLIDAWDIYALSGTETVIETQLRAAGYGPTTLLGDYGNPDVTYGDSTFFYADLGAYVEFRPEREGPRKEEPPYRTQFWVVFNAGFHPISGPPKPWGTFTWGETWLTVPGVWAPTGLTPDFYRTIMNIVMKWKPSDHVFRGFTFIVDDVSYADASIAYGDGSLMYGGAINLDIPLGSAVP